MKKIVVCGATGRQGGAVLRVCRQQPNWHLVGFSRDLSQQRVHELQSMGIDMLEADLLDLDSLVTVFEGAEGVFGVTQPWNKRYTKVDPKAELRQGMNIVDACETTGVKHLVLSTAVHLQSEKTGLPHVDIKIDIEQYAKQSGLPTTIIMPAQFMDNLGKKFFPISRGKIRGFIDGNAKVPYVATQDIGWFTKYAFENPSESVGATLILVGDFISGFELAKIMGRIRKQTFRYTTVPAWLIWLYSREFYKMRRLFEKYSHGYYADKTPSIINECRKVNPDLLSMEQYLLSAGWDTRIM